MDEGRPEQDRQDEYRLKFKLLDVVDSSIKVACKWGGICLCAYFAYKSVSALAGRTTIASIIVRVLGQLRLPEILGSGVGLVGVVYGLGQRSLRRRNIRRLAKAKQELETRLDPDRTSSGLTPLGTTRPED